MKTGSRPWITIHIAHSAEQAEYARNLLEGEGFMVSLHPLARSIAQSENCFEIMVLKSEASEARDLLLRRGI